MIEQTLPDLLVESWTKNASRTAIAQGEVEYEYWRLQEHTAQIGEMITSRKARTVGIVDRQDIPSRVYYLSAVRSGRTVVPISPNWPNTRTANVLTQAGVDLLFDSAPNVSSPGWSRNLEPTFNGSMLNRRVTPKVGTTGEIPAYILFTSGSTGRPKGVPVLPSAVWSFCRYLIQRQQITERDRISATFALTFDVSVFDVLIPALTGGTSVLPRSRSSLVSVVDYVTEGNLSVWFSVPSLIDVAHRLGRLSDSTMPTLRTSMFAGEQLSSQQAKFWAQAASNSELHNLYGPTETTIACTEFEISRNWLMDADSGPIPIGKPFDGVDLSIGSQRHERELLLSGMQVFQGYLRSEDDAEAFETKFGRRWYRTGDLVSRRDENLIFESRIDRQVKLSGHRIELGEIEAAFLSAGASRVNAMILGEGAASELVACIPSTDHSETMMRTARALLPRYMWPARIYWSDNFPTTANGKADTSELARQAMDPDPQCSR